MTSTITLTFGDQAENHVGMQKIGKMADCGFTKGDFKDICNVDIVKLHSYIDMDVEKAYIAIIRGGVDKFLYPGAANKLMEEQLQLDVDKKAFMYGRVVNKHARYNLCFSEEAQNPDYEHGKGRIVAFNTVPVLNSLRDALPLFLGDKAKELAVEANYYYDITKCGIGFHGDGERRRVVGVRLGATIPLHYQWFYKGNAVGERIKFEFAHGDIYVMSEKAVGTDWKTKNTPTLRHAAGAEKFLK